MIVSSCVVGQPDRRADRQAGRQTGSGSVRHGFWRSAPAVCWSRLVTLRPFNTPDQSLLTGLSCSVSQQQGGWKTRPAEGRLCANRGQREAQEGRQGHGGCNWSRSSLFLSAYTWAENEKEKKELWVKSHTMKEKDSQYFLVVGLEVLRSIVQVKICGRTFNPPAVQQKPEWTFTYK